MFRFLYEAYQAFKEKYRKNFQRISAATNYEIPVEDLQQDAVLAAAELEKTKGRPIDFSDPEDQKLVMGAVHMRNVVRPEKNMKYAARLDAEPEGEEGSLGAWLHQLQASDESDPIVTLIMRESAVDTDKLLADSYSQATAYAMVFVYFKNNKDDICAYLVISESTLTRRIAFAAATFRVQPSLFDRIERITVDFRALPGKAYRPAMELNSEKNGQWCWEF
jgi:hypothetical protein